MTTTVLNTKISEVENKIPYTKTLVKKADYNAKISGIEAASGQFTDEHFPEGHFPDGIFPDCQFPVEISSTDSSLTDSSPNGQFHERTFLWRTVPRMIISLNEQSPQSRISSRE